MNKINKISPILLCFLLMLLFAAFISIEVKTARDNFEKTKQELLKIEQSKIDKAEEEIGN